MVEALPAFDEFRPLFADQERALDAEDYERADEPVAHTALGGTSMALSLPARHG